MTIDTEEFCSGFQFDNYYRNEKLVKKGLKVNKAISTGTTIAGVIYKDGVVLGADTRSTSGDIVAAKACDKLHYIQPNMYCAGAGTAGDLDMTCNLISSQLELHRLNTGRQVQVVTAKNVLSQMLFRYQGHIGAHLILGGVDKTGPTLISIGAHGNTKSEPFQVMGSGSLSAMAIMETRFKRDLELEEAKALVSDAIKAGVENDLFSGTKVDLVVINRDGAKKIPGHEIVCRKGERIGKYKYPRGSTVVLQNTVKKIEVESEIVRPITSAEETKMETD